MSPEILQYERCVQAGLGRRAPTTDGLLTFVPLKVTEEVKQKEARHNGRLASFCHHNITPYGVMCVLGGVGVGRGWGGCPQ